MSSTITRYDVLDELDDHQLVAVDHRGQHCACGTIANFLEHFAAVGLTLTDTPPIRNDLGSGRETTRQQDLVIRSLIVRPDTALAADLVRHATRSQQQAIGRLLNAAGLSRLHSIDIAEPAPRTTWTEEHDDLLRDLHAARLSDKKIAPLVGFSSSVVASHRHALGLPTLFQGGRRFFDEQPGIGVESIAS